MVTLRTLFVALPMIFACVLPAQWQFVSAGAGPARHTTMAWFEGAGSHTGRVVAFGGFNMNNPLDDMWSWNAVSTAWSPVSVTVAPPPRWSAMMAYDSARQRIVMFGGTQGGAHPPLEDTWEWDGSTWTEVASSGPPPRQRGGMAYHAGSGKTVLFGGVLGAFDPVYGDTWTWDGTTWTQEPSGPPARGYMEIAYDEARDVVLLAGGRNPDSSFIPDDTWEWDGNQWTQRFPVNPLSNNGGMSRMAYDRCRQVTVLHFDGFQSGQTWEWDGAEWHHRDTSSPAYDTIAYERYSKKVLGNANGYSSGGMHAYTATGVPLTVAQCQPATGPVAQQAAVSVLGNGFRPGATVTVGGMPAASVTYVSSTQLDITTPAMAYGSHDVSVTVPGLVGCPPIAPRTLANGYTACSPTPAITSLTPAVGLAATPPLVTIVGSGFEAPCEVAFGTAPAVPATVVSSTQLTVVPPVLSAPQAVDVVVTNQNGTSCGSPSSTALVDGFVYVDPLVVAGLSPNSGASCGYDAVTVFGSGFHTIGGPMQVRFGGELATVVATTATSIDVETPAHLPGLVDVTVETPTGAVSTLASAFQFVAVPPHVTAVTPTQGRTVGGEPVTLTGTGFCQDTRVWFGDYECPVVTFVSTNQLDVITPLTHHSNGATAFEVDVTVRDQFELGNRLCGAFTFAPGAVLQVGSGHPFATVQAAIDAAADGDAVLVHGGTYNENLVLNKQILLAGVGSFFGLPRVQSVSASVPTIAVGSSATRATVIHALELVGGRSGIRVTGGTPTILGCEIHDNLAPDGAGVLVHGGADALLVDNEINNNPPQSAATRGGGVAVIGNGSRATMVDNRVYGNRATRGAGVYVGDGGLLERFEGNDLSSNGDASEGGGIWLGGSEPMRLTSSRIDDNAAVVGAGVFVDYGSDVTLVAVELRGNTAEDEGGGLALGGAPVQPSSVVARGCLFDGNAAVGRCGRGGGALVRGQAGSGGVVYVDAEFSDCRFYRNRAQVGGALAMEDKVDATLHRNEIAGNTAQVGNEPPNLCPWQINPPADYGGPGVYFSDCTVATINNTFHANTGGNIADNGGGLFARQFPASNSPVYNNVFTANTSPAIGDRLEMEPISHNAYDANTAATFALPNLPLALFADPLYVGDTTVANLPTTLGEGSPFVLQAGSPCIDAGFDLPSEPTLQVPAGGDAAMDIGAHEFGADMVTIVGEPTDNHCGTPTIAVTGTPQLGNTPELVATGLVPGNPFVILAIGLPAGAPVPLAVVGGVPGSMLHVAPILQPLVPADPFGLASYVFQTPSSPSLLDERIAFQFFEADALLLLGCGCTLPLAHTAAAVLRIRP